jgi:cellobiose epimerase
MLVTQARGLWTASRAVNVFPENPVYRKAADNGYQFLTGCMWDTEHGGFYQYYYPDSSQLTDPSFKLTYGNAFALFALSEYARINKDPSVLEWVRKAFNWLETSAHDPLHGGYFSIVVPANLAETGISSEEAVKRAGWASPGGKDQNTSIHLLEAFTSAYQVLPEEHVRTRLSEMLELVRDTMVDPAGYLRLFFTENWNPISLKDSSRDYILKNPYVDHVSFGHDIETAYLLADASQTLYGKPDPLTLQVAKKLMDHTLAFGFDKDYYGVFDKGYIFSPGNELEIIDSTKTWWAQAEAWHALALFGELYPEEILYQKAFPKMWSYIRQELIDHQYGGWYNNGLDISPGTRNLQKAHQWKSCYHDGRALFQVCEYAHRKRNATPRSKRFVSP